MLVQKYKNKDHPAVTVANYTARKDLKTARKLNTHTHTHTHTHTTVSRLSGFCLGQPG